METRRDDADGRGAAAPSWSFDLAWEVGGGRRREVLRLEPFDDDFRRGREEAGVAWCHVPRGSWWTGPSEPQPSEVPCSACPAGSALDQNPRRPARCRPLPSCDAEGDSAQSVCQLFASNPFVTGPCFTCADGHACNPLTGRRQCM